MGRKEFKKVLVLVVFLLIGSFITLPASSSAKEEYPDKPIEIMVPYPAGGSTDLINRTLADLAKKYLGQSVIVVNKPGGGTAIGTGYVFNAKPDGYTLGGVASATFTLRPHFFQVPYDVLKFTPIIQIAVYPQGLVVKKDAPWNSLQELITYAKNNPRKVKYVTTAAYDINQLIMEALAQKEGIKWDWVPGTGEATGIPMVLGGHVAFFAGASTWLPHVQGGTLKVLVTYGGEKMFADVPTLQELGYNFPSDTGPIIVGPPELPSPIVKKLHNEFKKAMDEPQYDEAIKRINLQKQYRNSEELKTYIIECYTKWGDFINKMGIKK